MNAKNSTQHRPSRGESAGIAKGFTLVELLTVIAIIGALAALVVGLSGLAGTKNKEFRAKAELNSLITGIESYKAEVGAYPPDGKRPEFLTLTDEQSKFKRFAYNQLFYELSGAVFANEGNSGFYTTLNKSERVSSDDLKKAFGVPGLQNSARDKVDVKYKGSNFKSSQYKELNEFKDVEVLSVPLPPVGDFFLEGKGKSKINPWLYDSSTTNRHNRRGFDVWIQYSTGKKTNIIGNWK